MCNIVARNWRVLTEDFLMNDDLRRTPAVVKMAFLWRHNQTLFPYPTQKVKSMLDYLYTYTAGRIDDSRRSWLKVFVVDQLLKTFYCDESEIKSF